MSACYPALLELIRNMLDNQLDYSVYEETLRETFTINAYPAFTLDKVFHASFYTTSSPIWL